MKGYAPRLALKERHKTARKWPIMFLFFLSVVSIPIYHPTPCYGFPVLVSCPSPVVDPSLIVPDARSLRDVSRISLRLGYPPHHQHLRLLILPFGFWLCSKKNHRVSKGPNHEFWGAQPLSIIQKMSFSSRPGTKVSSLSTPGAAIALYSQSNYVGISSVLFF